MLNSSLTLLGRRPALSWKPALVSAGLVFASLLLLRVQLGAELELPPGEIWRAGFAVGTSFDLGILAIIAGVSLLVGAVFGISPYWPWSIGLFVMWAPALANVLHFRFFQLGLDWWIVELHWRDVVTVSDSAGDLGLTPWIVASGAGFIAAVVVSLWAAATYPGLPRKAALVRALVLVVPCTILAILGLRMPDWVRATQSGVTLSDQILRSWWFELADTNGGNDYWVDRVSGEKFVDDPSELLARYRDMDVGESGSWPDSVPQIVENDRTSTDPDWPLVARFEPNPANTSALRKRLGLPEDGPVNVLVLFVEGLRLYEIEHPKLGPLITPRLRALFDEHAIYFTQGYSSSIKAGQTVRGQFSTLCSMLPNVLGAATYISHTATRLRCVQGLLKENGYRTLWLNSHDSSFHSKRAFELIHGTDHFFDDDVFFERGVTERVGTWGLADGPFLLESLEIIEEQAALGKPLFGHILTISTHHPHSVVPQGPIPEELSHYEDGPYLRYLSRLRYADESIGDFIDAFFASPLADSTAIVVLGDHGTTTRPIEEVSKHQFLEMRFRIPFAVISKNLDRPARVTRPVHQVDVAPTIARIAGVPGEITWVGRGLFSGAGRPWVYDYDGKIHYRVGDRACYTSSGSVRCYDAAAADPLYAAELVPAAVDDDETQFFRQVLRANQQAIGLNRILPRSQ